MKVTLARDGDSLLAGEVLVAAGGSGNGIACEGRVSVAGGEEERERGHVPYEAKLMEYEARVLLRARAVGIITHRECGNDGVEGRRRSRPPERQGACAERGVMRGCSRNAGGGAQ